MSKSIKHLIKIYDEYKQIKGMYDGGRTESDLAAPKKVVNALRKAAGGHSLDDAEPDSTPTPQYTLAEEAKRKAIRESYGYSEGGQVGMGDVQDADKSDRRLPVLQQGYGSPENDQLAQNMSVGLNPNTISPEVIEKYKQFRDAGAMSGGVKNIGSDIEAILAKNAAAYKSLKENGPQYLKQWQTKLQDLAHTNETLSDPSLLIGHKIPEYRGRNNLKIVDIFKNHDGSHGVRLQDSMGQGFNTDLNQLMHETKPEGYAEGGEVQDDPMAGNVSPEQYAANLEALKKQYKSQPVQGDDQLITADNNQPDQSEDTKSAEDKLVEEPYADEELAAKVKEEKPDEEMADDDSDEEDDSEPETMVASKEVKPDIKKEDKTREVASNEKPEQLQYTPSESPQENELARAQKQRDMNIAGQQIMKGAALFGAGASKTDPSQVLKSIGENDQYVNLPVQKYQEQMQNQGKDPNSPMTKVIENYLKSKGIPLIKGAAADDYLKFIPQLGREEALKTQIHKVVLQQAGAQSRAELGAKTKSDIASKGRDAAMERTKVGNEGKVAAAKAGQEFKMAKEQRDAQGKVENELNSTRGKQALMMAQRNLMAVKNAQKMLEEFPDTNKWTTQQVTFFNSELAKIAQGGVPTESQLHELSNPTAASKFANFIQNIANVPVGAEQGKFIANNAKYLKGLGDVSQQLIKDNMGNTLKANEEKLGPEGYKKMLYRHSDILGLLTPAQEKGLDAVMKAKGIPREEAIKALVKQGVIKDLSY